MSDNENGRFRLSRTVDLSAILALVTLFAGGLFAFGGAVWWVSAALGDSRLATNAQTARIDMVVQRIEINERGAAENRRTDRAAAAEQSEREKAFTAEVRANLAQISQALADVRTLVASQGNARR